MWEAFLCEIAGIEVRWHLAVLLLSARQDSEVALDLDRHCKVIKRAGDQHGIDVEKFRA